MPRFKSRGRQGRGRGNRGRSQRGGRPVQKFMMKLEEQTSDEVDKKVDEVIDLDKASDVINLFSGSVSFEKHYELQKKNILKYLAALELFKESEIEPSQSAKARCLATAFARKDSKLVDQLLEQKEAYGIVEISKCLSILDAKRKLQAVIKKMEKIEKIASKRKMRHLKVLKNGYQLISLSAGSVSGAVSRRIRKWLREIAEKDLVYYSVAFKLNAWKELADLVHPNPKKDFAVPWFLPLCFGSEVDENSLVATVRKLNEENINEMIETHPDLPYIAVKPFVKKLTDANKYRIVEKAPNVDMILWNFEDLLGTSKKNMNRPCYNILHDRLVRNNEPVNLPLGKLLERIVMIKYQMMGEKTNFPRYGNDNIEVGIEDHTIPEGFEFYPRLLEIASEKISKISLQLESPVAVIGDKSSSMSIAVTTSSIIATLLTFMCEAKLSFFNEKNWTPSKLPSSVQEVVHLAISTVANGCTSPAASLYPYYHRKEVIKTFIIVTDEEENTNFNNYRFAPLFKKYHEEVYPAKLVFVSFLSSQTREGDMCRELRRIGFNPIQVKFDGICPDLTKLSNLVGQLSLDSSNYLEKLQTKGMELLERQMKEASISSKMINEAEKVEDMPKKEVEEEENVVKKKEETNSVVATDGDKKPREASTSVVEVERSNSDEQDWEIIQKDEK